MQKVSDFLIEAKKVIEDPTHWTTGWFAKDSSGVNCSSLDVRAVCFCSLGAIERHDKRELLHSELSGDDAVSALAIKALENVMDFDVEDFNDEHTHEEVMQKWDEAINLAKAQESK